uniref:Small ribosomal subunit protein uS3c n=1 Tax=Hommersandiophycus borowitzkae TaxID=268573 RepID=A0A1G4NU69_9FLOR|nr:Ribosomal protein S3 [Hommersandiophycus borowitzkae]SCW22208.1 Ribosomal protein S3 [Hommersandiophycus borowitzkae]
MGQKTHPLGFRIGITQNHLSGWFANSKLYPIFLQEDFQIRQHIEKQLHNASLAKVEVERKIDQIEVKIYTARPGIVLGRFATGIESLRDDLKLITNQQRQIRIDVIELTEPDNQARLLADFITTQLEKRIAFRRAVRQAVQRAQRANVQGIKVQVSGRLNGAEIARSEWVREGRVPLQTLRANIDYSYRTAQTTYGVLGVKVWLFQGESLPNNASAL